MASSSRRRTITSGGWKAVLTVPEPYDTPLDVLVDAKNGYLPNPPETDGFYARPGFSLLNDGDPVYAPATPFRGQAIYTHSMLDGSRLNFVVIGGRLFREELFVGFTQYFDVTPAGITIDSSITTKVFFASLLDYLIVTDGVNRPWIGTILTSSPILGTYIDYDGIGGAWTAYGNPQIYLGSVQFTLNAVNGVSRRADISYSEPGLPADGYQQPDFDNNITLTTSNSEPVFALSSTNVALNYLRQRSIGSISGSDIGNLASSPTEDTIAFNVGTQAAQTLVQFGNAIYFCDAVGRPYVWSPGTPPRDIWKQMRGIVERQTLAVPGITATVATATLEVTLNKYVVGIWSPNPGTQASVDTLYIFDARTGTYEGFWQIEQDGIPIGIDCIGTVYDSSGRPTMLVLAEGGYIWGFNSLSSLPEPLTTEDGDWLTTEDGDVLVTESQPAVWQDNGEVPDIYVTTANLGDDDSVVLNVDQVTVTTLNPGPVRVTVNASMTPSEVEGEPEPSISQNGTYRFVGGSDAMGRGPDITVKPLSADEQWNLQRISAVVIPSLAGPEDS